MNIGKLNRSIGIMFFLLLATVFPCQGQLLIRTQGSVSVAPYIHGIDKSAVLYPGYRAVFNATIDFYQIGNLFLTGLVGNETVINRADTILVKLDRLHYSVSPGFRLEFHEWLVKGAFHHESINRIDQEESLGGASWQNIVRLGIGSKGSSYLFLPEEYQHRNNEWMNTFDAEIGGGIFLHGSESIWSAKNHNYRYEVFSLLRHHIGIFKNWAFFSTLRQRLWISADDSVEQQYKITFNIFRKGAVNFFGIFYTYTFHDTSTMDNEDRTGALGIKLVF